MTRLLHRWPGLLAAPLLVVLALGGAALSVVPVVEALSVPRAEAGLSVATLAARAAAAHPGLDRLARAPSGRITAEWSGPDGPGAAVIDPASGQDLSPAGPSGVARWLTDLHRNLFLGEAGRLVTAAGALAMLLLCWTGARLVARRAGGWRRWFAPLRGPVSGRLHVEIARLSLAGLAVSAATALFLSASGFGLLPDAPAPLVASSPSGLAAMPVAGIATLADTSVTALRELTWPYPGDPADVFTLKTDRATVLIDPGTGAVLGAAPRTLWQRAGDLVLMLHTGRGAAALGLLLGLSALGVPVMAGTGLVTWRAGGGRGPRLRGTVPAARATTVVLVGSETGSTWGFAATLAAALGTAGEAVHAAALAAFDPSRYRAARRILILTATWGAGAAPGPAQGFLSRLAAAPVLDGVPVAVLGFGDRGFPKFCGYAERVAEALRARGWAALLPLHRVDRQSADDFATWGRALGAAIGVPLALDHRAAAPAGQTLTLIARQDFGTALQAPAAILRFALPPVTLWQRLTGQGFARFAPGDLVGILPEGSSRPRYYSLASSRRDGLIEIAVRKHPGGLCSGQLMALRPGGTVRAILRRNPGFHAGRDSAPLILIGAGTGIAPLAGIVRANRRRRRVMMVAGFRHPDSDFLFAAELAEARADGRLARLVTAASRGARPAHVQDALRAEAAEVARLVRDGARVMVCGGRAMAAGVTAALDEILAPQGLTPATLKAEGRYAEDIY
jgi:sulfite reductase (NADPH) flavoprotein alpha-component